MVNVSFHMRQASSSSSTPRSSLRQTATHTVEPACIINCHWGKLAPSPPAPPGAKNPHMKENQT
eukprot:5379634-Karenia_brevis.AAC.1